MAHPKHEGVRHRYEFRCGYCGVSESSAGGELTVDHFVPVSAGGDDSDDNLVYACIRCNLNKGGFVSTTPDIAGTLLLLHPLRDNIASHVRENEESGYLESLTERGRVHITVLNLNRPALVAHRRSSRLTLLLLQINELHSQEIAHQKLVIEQLRARLRELGETLDFPPETYP